jgi:hypothetical protein
LALLLELSQESFIQPELLVGHIALVLDQGVSFHPQEHLVFCGVNN